MQRIKILKDVILSGCTKYGVNYVSEDTIINTAKEIVDILFEHANENASVDREFGGDGGGDGGDDNNNNKNNNNKKPFETRTDKIERLTNYLENKYFFASIRPPETVEGHAKSDDPLYYFRGKRGPYVQD